MGKTEDNNRTIWAAYNSHTIRVYQAYSNAIADSALAAGTFVSPPFKMDRMTWIKPSFLWMMYRSGWATKQGQERILAIDITRKGFEWALAHSMLSSYTPGSYESKQAWKEKLKQTPVRIQWDPDRDIHLQKMERRAIQVGLSGEAVEHYVHDWIVTMCDITEQVQTMQKYIQNGNVEKTQELLPIESTYPH